ncbi:MAG: DUF2924 domain-containing protein [Myxococcales bacterium]|nr:DUF2924 domain-containing protein [Myxococcales bacterium]
MSHVREARLALSGVAAELDTLRRLSDDDLRARFEAELGLPAKGRSSQRLLRRLAWKLQAEREGGLSPRALDRIAALAPPEGGAPRSSALPAEPDVPIRDPRLPPAGTILRRAHKGEVHEVLVRADDFLWHGRAFASLTALAQAITGSRWNGYAFFGAALAEAKGVEP